ncbi:MAG: hypothetical protein ACFFBQ_21210, partial [Promethearchaeota archaeon]
NGLKKPEIDFTIPRIELPYEAPHKYLLGGILGAIIFILGGGIYNLAETPLPMTQTSEEVIIIFPELNEQFLIESLIASLFIGLGAGGCYLIWYSTRFAYDTRTSMTLLIIGIIVTLIAAAGLLLMYDHKMRLSKRKI